ncbi:MAG: hypothetical protein AAFN70_20585 [Planctomycetota bacterium]
MISKRHTSTTARAISDDSDWYAADTLITASMINPIAITSLGPDLQNTGVAAVIDMPAPLNHESNGAEQWWEWFSWDGGGFDSAVAAFTAAAAPEARRFS